MCIRLNPIKFGCKVLSRMTESLDAGGEMVDTLDT